jgi:hypothetical protein
MATLLKACVVVLMCMGIDARPPVSRANGAFGLEEVISGELSSYGFSGTWISGECKRWEGLLTDSWSHCTQVV